MKYGMRTPNINKRISARTTGKVTRAMNKAVNPLYGKKGMGFINDPSKAVYNKVYNKTTTSVDNIINGIFGAILMLIIIFFAVCIITVTSIIF